MKKILLIIGLTLFTIFAYSQKPKVSAVRYTDVTTTERDNYSVPAGEFWRIYNTTTTQNEYWDGDSWEALSISEATFNLNSKNYSWGESYINNWRDLVLDDGATYFPNNGGYEIGRLHQAETNPSLHFIPAAVGEGVIYSVGKNRTNDLDVDRASIATYVDEDRIIQTALANVARIDYTDGDGAILVEPQSTNLALWSEDYTESEWDKTRSNITPNVTISPDGTLNASKLFEDSTASATHILRQTVTSSAGSNTYFIFVKKAENNFVVLREDTTGKSTGFDLMNGIIVVGTMQTDSASIIDFGNGWFKCSITVTTSSTSLISRVYLSEDGIVGNTIYNGDGVSGVYIWGAKLATDDSSYVKTEGTSVVRLADVINGAGDVNTFNSTEGVLFVEMAALSDDGTVRKITISDGTSSNRILFFYNADTNGIQLTVTVGGSDQANLATTITDVTAFNDFAIVYAENKFEVWVNGVKELEDTTGIIFPASTLDVLKLEAAIGGSNLYAKIRQLKVYKSISDAQKDFPYITNFFPLLLIGFRRRNKFKIAA